jgi:hypothetical protein
MILGGIQQIELLMNILATFFIEKTSSLSIFSKCKNWNESLPVYFFGAKLRIFFFFYIFLRIFLRKINIFYKKKA